MPRSTHPCVLAAPPVLIDDGVNSMSWTPLLYTPELSLQPLKGMAARPWVVSSVKALKVVAAGLHAQPLPNVEVPMTVGAASLVTSR